MTDQKDNQGQPTEISDDDLDGAQGGATWQNGIGVAATPGFSFGTHNPFPSGTPTFDFEIPDGGDVEL